MKIIWRALFLFLAFFGISTLQVSAKTMTVDNLQRDIEKRICPNPPNTLPPFTYPKECGGDLATKCGTRGDNPQCVQTWGACANQVDKSNLTVYAYNKFVRESCKGTSSGNAPQAPTKPARLPSDNKPQLSEKPKSNCVENPRNLADLPCHQKGSTDRSPSKPFQVNRLPSSPPIDVDPAVRPTAIRCANESLRAVKPAAPHVVRNWVTYRISCLEKAGYGNAAYTLYLKTTLRNGQADAEDSQIDRDAKIASDKEVAEFRKQFGLKPSTPPKQENLGAGGCWQLWSDARLHCNGMWRWPGSPLSSARPQSELE